MADDGGISRLKRRLGVIPNAVVAATRPELIKQANAMADTMRRFAPVKTGDLRDSIAVTPPDSETPPYSQPGGRMVVPGLTAAVTAGDVNVRYAHLVEYGHKAGGWSEHDVPPHPYFWPSVRLHNKAAKTAIKKAISKAVKDNWGKS